MPVRKTESRLPGGFVAADLGQTVSIGNVHLVSFLSSPLVRQRLQTYYVFVTDAAVQPTVADYNWTITDAGTVSTQSTTIGFLEYTPQNTGSLSISVQLKNAASGTIATITLQQNVVALNAALEALIDQQDNNIPSASHPATSREAINDLRMYADALLPPAQNALFNRLLLSVGYATAMTTPQVQRNFLLESYASILNAGRHIDLLASTENGIGISKVRPQVLAMFLDKPGGPAGTTYISFAELPATGAAQRTTALNGIRTNFNALSEDEKIDLFNLLRFPKPNYKMAQLIFEKLKDHYFSTSAIPQILGVTADGRKLVKQYETGPVVQTAGLGTTTFATAVLNIMQQQVWNIAALPMAAGGAVAPAPGSPPTAPFGAPEHVPALTFVAQPRLTDNGFIRTAFLYHDTYGLNPVLVASFEDLISTLSQQATPITRLRLVSHFFFDPTGQRPSNMNMAFFTPVNAAQPAGQSPQFTIKEYFKFGISDAEGLAAIAVDFLTRRTGHISDGNTMVQINFNNPPGRASLLSVVLGQIRASAQNILVPFSLQGAASSPSGAVNEFLRYCCDLFYVNNATLDFQDAQNPASTTPMPALGLTGIRTLYAQKISTAAAAVVSGSVTQQNATDLQAAVAGLSLANFPVANPDLGGFSILLNAEFLQSHNAFRTNLNAVKNRFTTASVVDIRGCRVGQDPDFMNAVRTFFGNTGNLPTVTAPEWFQSFPTLGFNFTNAEAGIDGFFNSGAPPTFTGTDVQREYSNWAGRVGIPSHISFWTRLAAGDAFDFLAFQWKNNVPGLGLPAVRLAAFNTLAFAAAVQRLGLVFNIAASVPAAATLQAFETNIVPHLASLKTVAESVAVMTASTPVADLTPANTIIQQAKTNLGQTLPAEPNPLTLAYLSTSIQTLKTFVTGQLNIAPFLTAMNGKLRAATAGIRYLTFIGLPLPFQSAAHEGNVGLIMLDGVKDDAVKSWVTGQWAEPVPNAGNLNLLSFNWNEPSHVIPNAPGPNDDDLTPLGMVLQVAALTVDHASTEMAINPTFEYQQHIKSTP